MKILVSWLNNWVDTSSLSINELTDIFESLGFEIEEVKNISPNYKNVCIGTVKHIESIKDAEKIILGQTTQSIKSSVTQPKKQKSSIKKKKVVVLFSFF